MTLRTYEIRIREIDCRIHLSGNIFHRKLSRDIKYNNSEKWKEFHVHHEVVYTKSDKKFLFFLRYFFTSGANPKEFVTKRK